MNAIEKFCTIKESGEWGIIRHYDGEYYHVGIAGDRNTLLVYRRDEITIPRKTPEWAQKIID